MLLNASELKRKIGEKRGIPARKNGRNVLRDQLRDAELLVKLRICSGVVKGGVREIGRVMKTFFLSL
ncbi:MAG: hypothetical protein ABI852_15755 [Gemmatimonadaceae bacterium]